MVNEKPLYKMKEYGTINGVRLSVKSAEILQREFGHVLSLRAIPGNAWEITAFSYVGRIELPDAVFLILPKLPIETVWDWLVWAYDISSLRFYPPVTTLAEMVGDPEWLVKFFVKECRSLCRTGLRTGYQAHTEALEEVRGQLQTTATLRRWMKQEYRFVCEYDEPTHWVRENRLLYAGLRDMVSGRYKDARVGRDIRNLLALFEPQEGKAAAALPVSVRDKLAELARLPLTRLNRHYARAFTWLRLYWRATSVSIGEGGVPYESFVLDMNELFESYIARRLTEELRPHGIAGHAQTRHWLGETGGIRIVPDLILKDRSGREVVLDTKYKLRTAQSENPDVFQMLAYMTARRASAGILLYAAGPERADKIKHTDKTIYRWSLQSEVSDSYEAHEKKLTCIISRIIHQFQKEQLS